jgi:hypothetical protein
MNSAASVRRVVSVAEIHQRQSWAVADAALAFGNNPAPTAKRYLATPAGWNEFEREFLQSMAGRAPDASPLSEKQFSIVHRLAEKHSWFMRRGGR